MPVCISDTMGCLGNRQKDTGLSHPNAPVLTRADHWPDRLQLDGFDYRMELLARGGCANAYLGVPHGHDGPRLVFKAPHGRVLANDHGLRNWQRECELLTALGHPAIPRPVAVRSEPRPFMAYEYLPGETLRKRLRDANDRLKNDAVFGLGIALLRILAHLHRQPRPIAHGDVRPENVLLDRHGQVRMLDFGCARYVDGCTYSSWIAAPRYLSPEQARGSPWDGRSDVYQVGLILYELITGAPFNQAADARGAILEAAEPRPFDHRAIQRRVGGAYSHWLGDVLQPEARSRMPSAACAANLLLKLLAADTACRDSTRATP